MRKYLQKDILELISTLLEGVQYSLEQYLESTSVIIVLKDCCVAIDYIDNLFEMNLSEDRYLFYKKINNDIKNKLERVINDEIMDSFVSIVLQSIEKQLYLIKSELTNEMEVKLEIVFMPYKASMWDSLESIWRATKGDPKCNSYVIPIPYYDRNSDGTFGEFHYEGGVFPEDVEITDYNLYNIEKCRPDAIYIHNPYDEYNLVTTVHPNYYSFILKMNTDMLIYVPYFVVAGKVPEGHMQLPVFNYMDKMIVQSEEAKEIYKAIIPESKLLALGSPKIDKIRCFEKNKPNIYKEWMDIIGSKKVVMYNISISGILEYEMKAIEKIKYIFSIFQKRKDIVLLWRPHPLIESTLKSMRPQLLDEYLILKRQFINEEIGIYDDTPDITASISISDAYIGEASSSIVTLFGAAGKPIFIMDMNITEEISNDERLSVHFWDCYIEKDRAWFFADKYNALCKMDLKTGEIEVVDSISDFSNVNFHYCDILKIDDKIIMQPYNSQYICEYDLYNKVFSKKTFDNPLPYANFDRMIHYNNYVFMKPKSYPGILRYDITNGDIKYYTDCMERFIQYQEKENDDMFIWGVYKRDNLLLMASSKVNEVLEFNMDTGKSKVHIVGSKGSNYFGMEFDGKDYWLIPNKSKAIVRWNYETGKTVEYTNFPEGFIGETDIFISIIHCGAYLLAFPRKSNMIVKIDIITGEMSEFNIQLHYKEGERRKKGYSYVSNYYFAKKINNKYVLALSSYDDSLLIINIEDEKVFTQKCRLNMNDSNNLISFKEKFGYINDDVPYASNEDEYWNLEMFLKNCVLKKYRNKINQEEAYSKLIKNIDGTCGEKIYKVVKDELC